MPKAASRNNDPKLSYFILRMLSDFGINADDKGIVGIKERASLHMEDNVFACRGRIPERMEKGKAFQKPDSYEDMWHTSPCNSPIISYSLLALGFEDEAVLASADAIKTVWDNSPWITFLCCRILKRIFG